MGRQKAQHLKKRKDGRYKAVYKGIEFMGNTEKEAKEKQSSQDKSDYIQLLKDDSDFEGNI